MAPAPVQLQRREIIGAQPGPHVLITGGVHGDEFEPMAALRQLGAEFSEQPGLVAALRGRVTLVPVVNEAAFVRGQRVAEDQLDLARTCPGRAGGSVTERTAHALSALIRTADFYLDLHTGGTELAVFPLTGYMMHPRADVLETQRRMARAHDEIGHWTEYDYVIVNHELNSSVDSVRSILAAERLKRARQPGLPTFVERLRSATETDA